MKKDYYIFKSGTLKRKDFNVIHIDTDGNKKILPINTVDNLFIFSHVDINADILCYLGKLEICIHFFDHYENYRGTFLGVEKLISGSLILKQAEFFLNNVKRIYIAKQFIESAMCNIHKNLLEYDIKIIIPKDKLNNANSIQEIMGIEGSFRNEYYSYYDKIFTRYRFEKRTKQPPLNEINSLISFGNMMCYCFCLKTIRQTQLNSTISYLHEPTDRRHSLSLDLAEIFKPIIIDKIIFKLINKNIIKDEHFEKTDSFCYIKENGKKLFVSEFEEKLNTKFYYRKTKNNVSYKQLILFECYKLIKHLLDIERYESLKLDW
jgi:CRISPR-associated protein Cas1